MNSQELFEQFNVSGQLRLPTETIQFGELPWNKHPEFDGVELKHIVTSQQTSGQFSYHLVRIAPNKAIGNHIHQTQLETHEVIAGSGTCVNNGTELKITMSCQACRLSYSLFKSLACHRKSISIHFWQEMKTISASASAAR